MNDVYDLGKDGIFHAKKYAVVNSQWREMHGEWEHDSCPGRKGRHIHSDAVLRYVDAGKFDPEKTPYEVTAEGGKIRSYGGE